MDTESERDFDYDSNRLDSTWPGFHFLRLLSGFHFNINYSEMIRMLSEIYTHKHQFISKNPTIKTLSWGRPSTTNRITSRYNLHFFVCMSDYAIVKLLNALYEIIIILKNCIYPEWNVYARALNGESCVCVLWVCIQIKIETRTSGPERYIFILIHFCYYSDILRDRDRMRTDISRKMSAERTSDSEWMAEFRHAMWHALSFIALCAAVHLYMPVSGPIQRYVIVKSNKILRRRREDGHNKEKNHVRIFNATIKLYSGLLRLFSFSVWPLVIEPNAYWDNESD